MAKQDLLIVCTDEAICPDGILEAAEHLAGQQGLGMRLLYVLSAAKTSAYEIGRQLDKLFELSKQAGADMIVYFTDKKSDIVRSYIKKNKIEQVMTTTDESSRIQGLLGRAGIHTKLWLVDGAGSIMQAYPAIAI